MRLHYLIALAFYGLSLVSRVGYCGENSNNRSLDDERFVGLNLLEEFRRLNERIFGSDNQEDEIEPVELFRMLKRIDKLSLRLDSLGLIEESEIIDWQERRELISLGEVGRDKCNEETFDRFRIIKAYSGYPNIIIEYLAYFSQKQYKICDPQFKRLLNLVINELSQEQQQVAMELSREVSLTISNDLKLDHITRGVFSYLKSKFELAKEATKEWINHLMKSSIDDLCQNVEQKLGPLILSHEGILVDEDIRKLADKEYLEWALAYKVCVSLASQRDKLLKKIHILAKNQ